MPINEKFKQDKDSTFKATENFLKTAQIVSQPNYGAQAEAALNDGKWTEALESLKALIDQKSGITLHKVEQDGVSVVIRDTRKADPIAVRASEALKCNI